MKVTYMFTGLSKSRYEIFLQCIITKVYIRFFSVFYCCYWGFFPSVVKTTRKYVWTVIFTKILNKKIWMPEVEWNDEKNKTNKNTHSLTTTGMLCAFDILFKLIFQSYMIKNYFQEHTTVLHDSLKVIR